MNEKKKKKKKHVHIRKETKKNQQSILKRMAESVREEAINNCKSDSQGSTNRYHSDTVII